MSDTIRCPKCGSLDVSCYERPRHRHVCHTCGFDPDPLVPATARPGVAYDRDRLVEVLVYHQRTDTSGCHCGWAVLGASYAEHVADVYEMSARAAEADQ